MRLKLLAISILVIFYFGCKKETQKRVSNTIESEETIPSDTLKLKLDNGKKWVVNNETHIGISKMDSVIKAFDDGDKKDYLKLGKDLSIQTSYIIRNCNMQGEAHDQLHVILVPMLNEISILKETNNKQENKKVLKNLEGLIDDYFIHFKF